MKSLFKTLSVSTFFCSLALHGALPQAPDFSTDYALDKMYPENLIINNRLLLKINGKPITMLDVVRKMDLLFYRQYPDLASSAVARYQFYLTGWRTVLKAVIDDYLIMADAEEKEVKVNDGEVREELEVMFGPDVVLNLDKLGMRLDEAFELLKTELTVQRMTSMMVRSKAMTDVHPITLRKKYEKVLEQNPPQNYWVYRVLSIRGKEHEKAADKAYALLTKQNIPFEELADHLQAEDLEITCSEEYRQKEKDLSLSYRATLESLSAGLASAPVSTEKGSRLFFLKGVEKVEPPPFKEVAENLRRELTQEYMSRYNEEYRLKLRKQYGVTEQYLSSLIPDNLQPFDLR